MCDIVLDTLKLLGEPARKELLDRLTPPENARYGVIWAVSELNELRAIPHLTTIVFQKPRNVQDWLAGERNWALTVLEILKGEKFDTAQLLPLIDPERAKEERALTLRIIERIQKDKDRRGVAALIALLPNSDIDNVDSALGDIGDPAAVEPLIQALKDKKRYLFQIARSLEKLNDSRAVGPLIAAVQEYRTYRGNEGIAYNAVLDALKKLTNIITNNDNTQWLEWWKKNESRFPR